MKKGFTLIELLAVIVILAIIAVIAIPIVLNIINDTKESTTIRTAENYLKALELSIAKNTLNNKQIKDGIYIVNEEGNLCNQMDSNPCENEIVIDVKNKKIDKGSAVEIKNGKIVYENTVLKLDNYSCLKTQSLKCVNANIDSISTIENYFKVDTKEKNNLYDYRIYGNSIQDETTHIEAQSVGEYDEATGKYKIPVKVSGKNIIDVVDDTKSGKGATVPFYRFDGINTKPGTYTFSSEIEVTDYEGRGTLLFYGYSVDGGAIQYGSFVSFADYNTYSSEKGYRYNFSFTVDDTLTFFYVFVQSGCTGGQITLKNAMLTINNTDLTYEPYVDSIITDIYISEPLRKIGDYVDYIDFINKSVVRNVEVTAENLLKGLSIPKIGDIELPNIELFEGSNYLEIDTKIKPSKTIIKYYK